jgi:hypothetical protein
MPLSYFYRLFLGLPGCVLRLGLHTETLYAFFFLFPVRATCPAHLILLDLITRMSDK